MARRRNTNVRRTAPRRRLFWARRAVLMSLTEDATTANRSLLATFQEAYDADLFGFTVTRIVGYYTWWAADSADISTTYNLSVGIRTDEQADTAIADTEAERISRLPVNSPHVDWMYSRNNLGIIDGAQTHSSTREAAENRVELDLRSQRRLDELGQSLYLLAGLNEYPGNDVFVWADLNVLCKRP